MRKLSMFNAVSLDGYFVDRHGDMQWAHQNSDDAEWAAFVQGNAGGGGTLMFGRVTYQMMADYWSSPMALRNEPLVAQRMNGLSKIVFSRTLHEAPWNNTTLLSGDPATEVARLKRGDGDAMVILGSGAIVAQLSAKRLIDEYQIVVVPIVLGGGRTLFDDMPERLQLMLVSSRAFRNGNVVSSYQPMS
jgi:dihydrofolate reductase